MHIIKNINKTKCTMKFNELRTTKSFSFFQNIEYIANSPNGSVMFINNDLYNLFNRNNYIIEELCKLYLTSLDAYNLGIRTYLNFSRNIPVILSNGLKLVPTKAIKDYSNIWININEVKYIDNNIVYFKSGNYVEFNNSLKYYKQQLDKVNQIEQYKLGLFY